MFTWSILTKFFIHDNKIIIWVNVLSRYWVHVFFAVFERGWILWISFHHPHCIYDPNVHCVSPPSLHCMADVRNHLYHRNPWCLPSCEQTTMWPGACWSCSTWEKVRWRYWNMKSYRETQIVPWRWKFMITQKLYLQWDFSMPRTEGTPLMSCFVGYKMYLQGWYLTEKVHEPPGLVRRKIYEPSSVSTSPTWC